MTSTEAKRKAFLDDLLAVCRKHGLVLCHEDMGGSFLVVPASAADVQKCEKWLLDAYYDESAPLGMGRK